MSDMRATAEPAGEPPPWSDAQLVCEAQAGSRHAFESLVKRYQQRLLAFLRPYVDYQIPDAEDLVQETFLRAYRHLKAYNPRWAFSTWLFNIAVRLAISERRKRRRTTATDFSDMDLAASDPSPHEHVIQRDEIDGLWAAAREHLSEEQYAMLWLTYVEQMSTREVSRAMNKTQVTVKVGLHRARCRLARHLARAAKNDQATYPLPAPEAHGRPAG